MAKTQFFLYPGLKGRQPKSVSDELLIFSSPDVQQKTAKGFERCRAPCRKTFKPETNFECLSLKTSSAQTVTAIKSI